MGGLLRFAEHRLRVVSSQHGQSVGGEVRFHGRDLVRTLPAALFGVARVEQQLGGIAREDGSPGGAAKAAQIEEALPVGVLVAEDHERVGSLRRHGLAQFFGAF